VIKSRRLRGAGDVERMGRKRNAYDISVRKTEDKRPIGRPRRSWKDIRMGLRETGCESVERKQLAEDKDQWRALVNKEINLRVP
jgi:hypothetical protein